MSSSSTTTNSLDSTGITASSSTTRAVWRTGAMGSEHISGGVCGNGGSRTRATPFTGKREPEPYEKETRNQHDVGDTGEGITNSMRSRARHQIAWGFGTRRGGRRNHLTRVKKVVVVADRTSGSGGCVKLRKWFGGRLTGSFSSVEPKGRGQTEAARGVGAELEAEEAEAAVNVRTSKVLTNSCKRRIGTVKSFTAIGDEGGEGLNLLSAVFKAFSKLEDEVDIALSRDGAGAVRLRIQSGGVRRRSNGGYSRTHGDEDVRAEAAILTLEDGMSRSGPTSSSLLRVGGFEACPELVGGGWSFIDHDQMIPESNDDDEEEENELRIQGEIDCRSHSSFLMTWRERTPRVQLWSSERQGLSRWRRATTRGGISKKSLMLTNGSSRVEDSFLGKEEPKDSACSAKLGDDPLERSVMEGRSLPALIWKRREFSGIPDPFRSL
ncbi:hypothetical protein BC829DRAFT_421178 [Chytridium lagenaria]|nr:hypothetical protein BC829DRAFT_421178 [Chytridium lagenaria]